MARSAPVSFSQRLRRRVAAYHWRPLGILAAVSFVLSISLILYLFGTDDRFFGRLGAAFFVGFCLLAVTFQAIIPFIGWATTHWFGKSWSGAPTPAPSRRVSSPTNSPSAARRPSTLP